MAQTNIPHYLEAAAAESGDTKDELLLCLVQAVEQQTQAIEEQTAMTERVARTLEEWFHQYDMRGPA